MDPLPSPDWSTTLSAFTAWLRDQGRRPLTIRAYRHDLTLLARWLTNTGIQSPHNLTPQALRAYAQDLQVHQRLEPTTVNRRIAAMRQWSRFLTLTHCTTHRNNGTPIK